MILFNKIMLPGPTHNPSRLIESSAQKR